MDEKIKQIYFESKRRYGSPKITKVLNQEGIKVSQKRVARRMKKLDLRSITVKKYNHASSSNSDETKEYPNLLKQTFSADKPSEKWVGDITYIYTNAHLRTVFEMKLIRGINRFPTNTSYLPFLCYFFTI